jgi:TPR repeat protein
MMGYFEDCGRAVGAGAGQWHALAAAQGHPLAQLSLGLHLLCGSGGVCADRRAGVGWLEAAAAQGVEDAARRVRALAQDGDVRAAAASIREEL